jgi:hypothetical protein
MSTSAPFLPVALVNELRDRFCVNEGEHSACDEPHFHAWRLQILAGRQPESLRVPGGGGGGMIVTRPLSAAIAEADVLAFCELLRFGTAISMDDLCFLVGKLSGCITPADVGFVTIPKLTGADFKRPRLAHIVRTVVEHSVALDELYQTLLLDVVRHMHDWPLVAFLLEHGLRGRVDTRPLEEVLPVLRPSRVRLEELIAQHYVPGRPAPPVRCRCFSGRALRECHLGAVRAQPVPDTFLCPCASGASHAACCGARGRPWTEFWDGAAARWVRICAVPPTADVPAQTAASTFSMPHVLARTKELVQRGLVDRAFYAAMRATGMVVLCVPRSSSPRACLTTPITSPQPPGRVPPAEGAALMHKWNAAVDAYAANAAGDARTDVAIARAAKINVSVGALYETCERDGCTAAEPETRLLRCSGCRRVRLPRAHARARSADLCRAGALLLRPVRKAALERAARRGVQQPADACAAATVPGGHRPSPC